MIRFFVVTLCLAFISATPSFSSPIDDVETLLTKRLAKLQNSLNPGHTHYAVTITADDQSIYQQSGGAVVRIPVSLIKAAKTAEMLDTFMLIGLAQTAHNPPKPQRSITGAARVAFDTLAFFGEGYAEGRVRDAGRANIDYELVGRRQEDNPIPVTPTLNSAQQALAWAQQNGACEARIISELSSLAKADKKIIGHDARRTMKALGAVVWSPNTRCAPDYNDADYQAIIALITS